MHTYSMNYYEAYIFVKDRRYSINPNRGFKRQLCEWDQKRKVERSLFRFIFFLFFWGICFHLAYILRRICILCPPRVLPVYRAGASTTAGNTPVGTRIAVLFLFFMYI
jgi:hypothetical protein